MYKKRTIIAAQRNNRNKSKRRCNPSAMRIKSKSKAIG